MSKVRKGLIQEARWCARAGSPLPHRAAKLAVASARRPYQAAATEHGPPGAVATSCDPPAGGLILRSPRFPPRQRRNGAIGKSEIFSRYGCATMRKFSIITAVGETRC